MPPAKPGLHHSVSEWTSNNQQLSATAQHEQLVSMVIRQEGRSLRNETNCKVGSHWRGNLQESSTVGVALQEKQYCITYVVSTRYSTGNFYFLRRQPGMRVTPVAG